MNVSARNQTIPALVSSEQHLQPIVSRMDAAVFLYLGNLMMRRTNKVSAESEQRRFKATFGTNNENCAILWARINEATLLPLGEQPKHLLWGLMFLKLYCSE